MCICTLVQNQSIIYCTTKSKLCKRPAAILSTKKGNFLKSLLRFDFISTNHCLYKQNGTKMLTILHAMYNSTISQR